VSSSNHRPLSAGEFTGRCADDGIALLKLRLTQQLAPAMQTQRSIHRNAESNCPE
jgi:hypothetical protein